MENKIIGVVVADFFTILSLALLILMAEPETPPVIHKIVDKPSDSILIRKHKNSWQEWDVSRSKWQVFQSSTNGKLLINCEQMLSCLNLFKATSREVEQIIIALPEKNKIEAAKLFYESCSVKRQCKDIIIIHNTNKVTLTTT